MEGERKRHTSQSLTSGAYRIVRDRNPFRAMYRKIIHRGLEDGNLNRHLLCIGETLQLRMTQTHTLGLKPSPNPERNWKPWSFT